MRDLCTDEGILQSYYDGELSHEKMESVATHIAACGVCAVALREVESENGMLRASFARETELSVPTARLRARLDAAIAELQPQPQPFAERRESRSRLWLGSLAALFTNTPQRAIGFASLAAVITFAVIFGVNALRRSPVSSPANSASTNTEHQQVAVTMPAVSETPTPQGRDKSIQSTPVTGSHVSSSGSQRNSRASMVNAGYTSRRRDAFGQLNSGSEVRKPHEELPQEINLLPGERSYLKTIAALDTDIKAGGDQALRPSLRVEYERNLAVVDQAIAATRVAAQRNPNDADAAEFLLTAYQSKIDLMNTVAQQARLTTTEH